MNGGAFYACLLLHPHSPLLPLIVTHYPSWCSIIPAFTIFLRRGRRDLSLRVFVTFAFPGYGRLWVRLDCIHLLSPAVFVLFFFFFFALYGYFGVIFIIFYGLPHMISRLGRIGWDEDMSRSRHVLGKEVC